jgi:rod shape-determining protein MreD
MLRSFVLTLIIIINTIFQSTLIEGINVNGITPNFIIVAVVSFGVLRGRYEGALTGIALGLLQDIFYGQVIGFYTLLYLYIGFFSGYLHRNFYRDSILIPGAIIAISDLIYGLIIFIFTFFFRGKTDILFYMINVIIPEITYTTFLGILIYRLYYIINKKIEKEEIRKENIDKV